jgi:uncharacterized protein YdeI (YjbR/CyaY-like superfamily)
MNPSVDWFFAKETKWKEAYAGLRELLLRQGLEEELKWGCPCYTVNGRNIVLIHGFKNYCALLFMKGALLTDPEGVLVQQTPNVQSARQLRFTGAAEIKARKSLVGKLVKEAIEVEKRGETVALKKPEDHTLPAELEAALKESGELRTAFDRLTPGRRRGYLLYFSAARQSSTRLSRIKKCYEKILQGKGLND